MECLHFIQTETATIRILVEEDQPAFFNELHTFVKPDRAAIDCPLSWADYFWRTFKVTNAPDKW